jgi:hypothetical protein
MLLRDDALGLLEYPTGWPYIYAPKKNLLLYKVKVNPCTGTEALYRPYDP